MGRMRFVLAAAAVALAAGAAPAIAKAPAKGGLQCSGDPTQVRPITLTVDGQPATGQYAAPRDKKARGLVVFFHGYGHRSASWAHHMSRVGPGRRDRRGHGLPGPR